MVQLENFSNPNTEPINFDVENLSTQFRSVPSIGNLFSQYAYDGKLNHDRKEEDIAPLNMPGLNIKSLNYVKYPISKYDNIFNPHKMDGSNIHVYSALLTVEMCRYIAENNTNWPKDKPMNVGVICPYAAQAQLMNKLIEQFEGKNPKVNFTVGTVHSFQGDQCEVVFAVINTSPSLRSDFLDRQCMYNVAISRASDYLFLVIPDPNTPGFSNMKELGRLGYLSTKLKENTSVLTCDEIEEVIFGQKFYLENSTFITSHQLANVYTHTAKRYEIRFSESAIDIQVGGTLSNDNLHEQDNKYDNNLHEPSAKNETLSNNEVPPIAQPDLELKQSREDGVINGKPFSEILQSLLAECSAKSIYTAIQLVCSKEMRLHCGILSYSRDDIRKATKKLPNNPFMVLIKGWLFSIDTNAKCPFKGYNGKKVEDVTYEEFVTIFEQYRNKPIKHKAPKLKKSHVSSPLLTSYHLSSSSSSSDKDKPYEKFEYGLSDW